MTAHPLVPDKPSLEGLESKFVERWLSEKTYEFDRSQNRENVFSIDTPPPTVSGSLHVGHVFSYTHTDCIARFQRMQGKAVFYPMGWDDNGLPTERRVQNYFNVRCDPSLPYDPNFEVPENLKDTVSISRRNFIELCEKLTLEDEKAFEDLWQRLGISVDWNLTYQTVNLHSQRISQIAFLRNFQRGEAYQSEAPTLWDVTFQTAVAQAELEDRERPGAYHRVAFKKSSDESDVLIETSRPELLPACVALVANPDDDRYKSLFGTTVISPLFGVEVPVVAHHLADPEKGTGIAMICTFGDLTDVIWWREFQLPTRPVIGFDGRIIRDLPSWIESSEGKSAYERLAGKTAHSAKEEVALMLGESGDLRGDIKPITHPVKFFEKGDKPLEIVTTRQWYIKNGGRDDSLRTELLKRGKELRWHPSHMDVRYQNWVEGLNGDWLISRQRFFGVPIPLWYPIDADGKVSYESPIIPAESELPIDPASHVPSGYQESDRGKANGFIGDGDVMDTWATSSLTPQIAGGWETDEDLWKRVWPFDMRPQAHEIIRTWLFSSVVRAHLEHNSLPWTDAAISGWILDPDRKKMSKSKGNVVTPIDLLDEHGSDAVRYWAASGRPGTDTAFDVGQMKIGRRLAIKILNASRFALSLGAHTNDSLDNVTVALDQSMLRELDLIIEEATKAFNQFNYTKALEVTEKFFWVFCDDYVELVKDRVYGSAGDDEKKSAQIALGYATETFLKLFAPFMPFVTEEVWSWWKSGSVHRSAWPVPHGIPGDRDVLACTSEILTLVRKIKSDAQVSMKTEIADLRISGPATLLNFAKRAEVDLQTASRALSISWIENETLSVEGDLQKES
ncbi:MAG: valine--tRNA ligase [Candidatus Nanopelagicales bacterium]